MVIEWFMWEKNVCVCVCVNVYVYMYVYVYMCVCVRAYVCICVSLCVCVCCLSSEIQAYFENTYDLNESLFSALKG